MIWGLRRGIIFDMVGDMRAAFHLSLVVAWYTDLLCKKTNLLP